MDCSAPGFPILHRLPEFAQTRVHWVSDTIQPSPATLFLFYLLFSSIRVFSNGWEVTNSLGGRKQWLSGLGQGPPAESVGGKELLGEMQMEWNKAEPGEVRERSQPWNACGRRRCDGLPLFSHRQMGKNEIGIGTTAQRNCLRKERLWKGLM